MWLFGEMWKALKWWFRRPCHWCLSKEPGKWSHGMTRPGYVGWRRFCAACVLRMNTITPPRGRAKID